MLWRAKICSRTDILLNLKRAMRMCVRILHMGAKAGPARLVYLEWTEGLNGIFRQLSKRPWDIRAWCPIAPPSLLHVAHRSSST